MTSSDAHSTLQAARDRATSALRELDRQHAQIVAASQNDNADDEHDPEGSTIAFERSQVDTLRAQAQRSLDAADAALARLAAGTYGRCVRCGAAISPGRLEARPTADTCIDCA